MNNPLHWVPEDLNEIKLLLNESLLEIDFERKKKRNLVPMPELAESTRPRRLLLGSSPALAPAVHPHLGEPRCVVTWIHILPPGSQWIWERRPCTRGSLQLRRLLLAGTCAVAPAAASSPVGNPERQRARELQPAPDSRAIAPPTPPPRPPPTPPPRPAVDAALRP